MITVNEDTAHLWASSDREFTQSGQRQTLHRFSDHRYIRPEGLVIIILWYAFVFVLWRSQSLIPLMGIFIFINWLGRLLIEELNMLIETIGTAPDAVGIIFFSVLALIMH